MTINLLVMHKLINYHDDNDYWYIIVGKNHINEIFNKFMGFTGDYYIG